MARKTNTATKPRTDPHRLHDLFERFAQRTAIYSGQPIVFMTAFLLVLVWAISGPLFAFSDTWQLMINTTTTIITFLMVFLIQSTQNRDTLALQLKLSELLLVIDGTQNKYAALEDLPDHKLEELHSQFRRRARVTLRSLRSRSRRSPGRRRGRNRAS